MDETRTPQTEERPVSVEMPKETVPASAPAAPAVAVPPRPTKFCSHCGGKIDEKAVICPLCGCQVEQMAPAATPNIVINNANNNTNTNDGCGSTTEEA